jgi:transcriptional regulator with XRE-family HTH domain
MFCTINWRRAYKKRNEAIERMKMSKQYIKNKALRKSIGLRFKEFREKIRKTQHELADELNISQSTYNYIETGKSFPGTPFQNYLYFQYQLNLNWLINGEGEMIMTPVGNLKYADLPILFWHIDDNDPRFEKYVELISLMRISFIEQIILGKLEEVKAIAKEEIKEFFDPKHVDQDEKPKHHI